MVNGSVMTYVANELAIAERARALPWSQEQEQAVRTEYLRQRVGSGLYPRLAEAVAEGPGPVDPEEGFERVLGRVLDAFA